MDLLRGKKDKDKTATTVHPKETKQDEGGDVGNVAVNSEEKEKKLHMYLAETFMNLGNVYKGVSKYDKAEQYYARSCRHYKRAVLTKEQWEEEKATEKAEREEQQKEQQQQQDTDNKVKERISTINVGNSKDSRTNSMIHRSNLKTEENLKKRETEITSKEQQLKEKEEDLKKKEEQLQKQQSKPMTEEELKKKQLEEEALKKLEEANKRLQEMRQLQDKESTDEKTGFFKKFQGLNLGGKKKEDTIVVPAAPAEIGLPTNVTHEGHIGFNKTTGEFATRNLPPEYQKLFDNLNQTLKGMGVAGITEKEAKLLLKSLPVVMADKTDTNKPPAEKLSAVGATLTSFLSSTKQDPAAKEQTKLQAKEKEITELKKKITDSKKEQKDLESQKHKLEVEVLQLKAKLEQYEKKQSRDSANKGASNTFDSQIETLSAKFMADIEQLRQQVDNKSTEIDKLTEENRQLQQRLEQLGESPSEISTESSSFAPGPPPPPPAAPPPPPSGGAPASAPKLKSTKKETTSRNTAAPAPEVDARSQLMNAIKGPQRLKKVDESEKLKKEPINVDDQNVLNLIAKALIERRNHIKDDQDEEGDDNIQEWL